MNSFFIVNLWYYLKNDLSLYIEIFMQKERCHISNIYVNKITFPRYMVLR